MRKIIIIIPILILSVLTTSLFAIEEQAPANEETKKTSLKPLAAESTTSMAAMSLGAGGISDASPGSIGGSAMPFLQESFQTDLATGAATLSVPITVPPGRKNMQPGIAISYSSNNSNGICGVGWAIPTNLIQRSTKNGVPTYDSTDTFMFNAGGSNAELVNVEGDQYRAKIESAFMKYVFSLNIWTVYDKSGIKYTFGQTQASRVEDSGNSFAWYLDKVEDVYGNYITYIYDKPADGQIYLTEINYTASSINPSLTANKQIIFSYETRDDKLYSYRSGWKVATTKRLNTIEVLLTGNRVWLYDLEYTYSSDTSRSLLESVMVYDNVGSSLPPKQFTYQSLD